MNSPRNSSWFGQPVVTVVTVLAAVVALGGCGSPGDQRPGTDAAADVATRSDAHATDAVIDGHTHTTPDAATPPDAAPSCVRPSRIPAGEIEEPRIATNFDVASQLVPAWGTGAIPASGAPDVVGAFRFICNPGHLSYDDPIVYPGQPGRAHLHQFFGNTLTNACSDYASLRTTGESTCNNALNRSAYWIPAMMNGQGGVVRPDYISIYYKRYPVDSPLCTQQGTACVDLPRGLRFVFGANTADPMAPGRGYFNCDGPTATSGHYPDIPTAAANCPMGNRLGAVVSAPPCWNGRDLDSPDHRSHMAYASYGDWGYLRCPATHPYIVPTFTLGAWYRTDEDLDRSGTWDRSQSTWHLSSDAHDGTFQTPGSTFHADWWGAWDDDVMQTWTDHCINRLLNCSGGDLGNGQQLRMFSGFSMEANPRVVAAPPHSGP